MQSLSFHLHPLTKNPTRSASSSSTFCRLVLAQSFGPEDFLCLGSYVGKLRSDLVRIRAGQQCGLTPDRKVRISSASLPSRVRPLISPPRRPSYGGGPPLPHCPLSEYTCTAQWISPQEPPSCEPPVCASLNAFLVSGAQKNGPRCSWMDYIVV